MLNSVPVLSGYEECTGPQAEPSRPRGGSASPRSSVARASMPGQRRGPISGVGHSEFLSHQLELDITEFLALSQSCLSARLSRAHLTSLRSMK